jgi:hypothetical protein
MLYILDLNYLKKRAKPEGSGGERMGHNEYDVQLFDIDRMTFSRYLRPKRLTYIIQGHPL